MILVIFWKVDIFVEVEFLKISEVPPGFRLHNDLEIVANTIRRGVSTDQCQDAASGEAIWIGFLAQIMGSMLSQWVEWAQRLRIESMGSG